MVTDNNSKIDIIKLYPIPTQDSEEPKIAGQNLLMNLFIIRIKAFSMHPTIM